MFREWMFMLFDRFETSHASLLYCTCFWANLQRFPNVRSSRGQMSIASLTSGGPMGKCPKLPWRSVNPWANVHSFPSVRWTRDQMIIASPCYKLSITA